MPKMLSEVASGYQVSRSSNEGQLADTQTRSFRVMLNSPGEGFDIQGYCGVYIGDPHPFNTNVFCTSFDTRFDGDSRMVLICTFQYQTTAGGGQGEDPKSFTPDVRPADWTTSTSLIEQPLHYWRKRIAAYAWDVDEAAAENPAGDIYDGATQLTSIVNIQITQHNVQDPTRHNLYGGYVNEKEFRLGSLVMKPHTLMFRGVSSAPVVESYGGLQYRGWTSTYEFAFKPNRTTIAVSPVFFPGMATNPVEVEVDLGWDIAIPQTGLNVLCFTPSANPQATDFRDRFGQPLKMDDDLRHIIMPPDGAIALPVGLVAGEKARAMIKIPIGDKFSLNPSASPIALNDDGTPRDTVKAGAANPPRPRVIVYGYQVQPSGDLETLLGLRTN